jgi:hypothetical protein
MSWSELVNISGADIGILKKFLFLKVVWPKLLITKIFPTYNYSKKAKRSLLQVSDQRHNELHMANCITDLDSSTQHQLMLPQGLRSVILLDEIMNNS